MASDQSGETSGEMFHDIEVECNDAIQGKLALQLHVTQPGNCPLPVGVITERSLMANIEEFKSSLTIKQEVTGDDV